jgi:exodeoxyribonuclease VII small subunit
MRLVATTPAKEFPMIDKTPSFDDGLDRLEALVQQLESGSLSLEEALARFEEGVQLSQALQKQLAEAQRKVEVLKAGLGGEYRTEPLDGGKEDR